MLFRINVNDPGLITLVNKLQDVFTTVGVGLGKIYGSKCRADSTRVIQGTKSDRSASDCCRGLPIQWEEFRLGEHRRQRLVRRNQPDPRSH